MSKLEELDKVKPLKEELIKVGERKRKQKV
jgi:hypothetical protein